MFVNMPDEEEHVEKSSSMLWEIPTLAIAALRMRHYIDRT